MKDKDKEKEKEKIKEKDPKNKKSTLIIDIIFVLLTTISSAFLIYTLTLLGSIEIELRCIVTGLVAIFDLILIINLFRRKKKKKKKQIKKSIKRFFLSLLILLYLFGGYTIYRVISSIDNMNKDFVTTSSSLVTLKGNKITDVTKIKNAKIAIGNDKNDSESYQLPLAIINEYDLSDNNTILEYEDYQTMIRDLYAKEVDYIFLPTNYASIYGQLEEYETLEDDTKIIVSKSREEEKVEDEELLGTGKDVSEPFTILLMGVDSKSEGIENAKSFNGDALMLITFNPNTLTATMLSIPRDTYVPIACFSNQAENKITHAAAYGTSCLIKTIQNFTGIKIDYYVKLNFAGVVDLVDALGGIDVNVPYAFCEQNSKRKWGSQTIYVEKGKQHLNGEQALALARNRKSNIPNMKKCGPEYNKGTRNDFVRGQNQQLVVQGIVSKAKNLETVTKVYEILDAISNNMDTNMSRETILSFYNIAKDIMTTTKDKNSELVTIQKLYLAGSDQKIYDERSRLVLYNYIPNQDSLSKIITAMKENLGITKPKMDKTFDYSIEELYTPNVIGKTENKATTLYSLIPDFTTYTKSKADSWAAKNGFTIIYNEVEDINGGIITAQSYPAKKRIDLCSDKTITLTITVAKETSNNNSSGGNNSENNDNNENNNSSAGDSTTTPPEETPGNNNGESSENNNE